MTAGGAYATATLQRLDDGMHDSVAQAFNRRVREDRAKAKATQREPWDSTVWHYVPSSLKGLRCVTVRVASLSARTPNTHFFASLRATRRQPSREELCACRHECCCVCGTRSSQDEPWARDEETFEREFIPIGVRDEVFDDRYWVR